MCMSVYSDVCMCIKGMPGCHWRTEEGFGSPGNGIKETVSSCVASWNWTQVIYMARSHVESCLQSQLSQFLIRNPKRERGCLSHFQAGEIAQELTAACYSYKSTQLVSHIRVVVQRLPELQFQGI